MKRVLLLLLAGCGGGKPAPVVAAPPPPPPATAEVAPVPAASAPAPPPKLVLPRDAPRTLTLKPNGDTEMSLGDIARSDRWRVELTSYDDGVLTFSGAWRALEKDTKTATVSESRDYCDFEKMGTHIRIAVRRFPTATQPTASVAATETDGATEAKFGQELRDDGIYRFGDGLRVQYHYTSECDYEPSPCIETHKVTAYYEPAKKPPLDATLKPPQVTKRCELGHGFAAVHRHLRVTQTCQ